MDELLRDFPIRVEVPVRWGDMDALGHVNNALYFRYFEEPRVAMMSAILLFPNGEVRSDGIGPILAATDCRFKFPVTYPDTLECGVRIDRIERERLFFRIEAVSQRHGKRAAVSHTEMVILHYAEHRKLPLPADTRAAIIELQPELRTQLDAIDFDAQ